MKKEAKELEKICENLARLLVRIYEVNYKESEYTEEVVCFLYWFGRLKWLLNRIDEVIEENF